MEKWDIVISFQDILIKIGGSILTDLSQRLAQTKFWFLVCVSVCWFICSLKWKNWDILSNKVGKVTHFSKYPPQIRWTSTTGPISKIVCVYVSWFFFHYEIKKFNIFLSFQDIFTKVGGSILTDLSHRLAKKYSIFLSVCLSVGSFVHWKI